MLIDFHTHAFPPEIAERALRKLSHDVGGVVPQTEGTLESLKKQMDEDGVDLSVVLAIATNPKQMHKVNDYAFRMDQDERIVAFGSVHPEAPDALEELERIKAAGLKGVKLHPEFQGFYADDEKLKPIYRKLSELGLITLFHAGEDYGYAPPYHAMPEHLLRALGWFDSPVVAAHWGGIGCGQQVLEKLCGEHIFFDLSYGYGAMPKPTAQAILERHGADKLLFASDSPWHRPAWEMRLLDSLELTDEERERILWKNAKELLGI
ncbi:MAG: amidohydrolase family protein [Oscillospiraceae bacterium]|nr:amidohydrolase family protein [Oscillospiraceae bacterium]